MDHVWWRGWTQGSVVMRELDDGRMDVCVVDVWICACEMRGAFVTEWMDVCRGM